MGEPGNFLRPGGNFRLWVVWKTFACLHGFFKSTFGSPVLEVLYAHYTLKLPSSTFGNKINSSYFGDAQHHMILKQCYEGLSSHLVPAGLQRLHIFLPIFVSSTHLDEQFRECLRECSLPAGAAILFTFWRGRRSNAHWSSAQVCSPGGYTWLEGSGRALDNSIPLLGSWWEISIYVNNLLDLGAYTFSNNLFGWILYWFFFCEDFTYTY